MVQLDLNVIDLGRMDYREAIGVQRAVHRRVVASTCAPTLLLVEHDPVITMGRRAVAREHLLAAPDALQRQGIEVVETDRGGDITYHGPGQLVAYPIMPLNVLGLNIGRYMRWLERVVIDALCVVGQAAFRQRGLTGVWVREDGWDDPAKVAALGVRVERNVTLHGLALNVATRLDHFQNIVPCGLHGRRVTSLARCMGGAAPSVVALKPILAATWLVHWQRRAATLARA